MGEMELNGVTVDTLEDFRLYLVEDRKLALKTARNIIDGILRAMFRDAGRRIERNPFNDLPENWWPRLPQPEADPYTEVEWDKILKFYRERCSHGEYAFVYFRFYTGTRPSEAVALKWGKVDLISGRATSLFPGILVKRMPLKHAPAAERWTLLPNVIELLKTLLPLRVGPKTYAFTDASGQPIDQSEFARGFQGALRVLEMRQRPFYNTGILISVSL